MRFFGCLLAVAAVAAAQNEPMAPSSRPRLVDAVAATVNDSAILFSEVQTGVAGRVRSMEQSGLRLAPSDVQQVMRTEREALIDKHQMAHSAKSLGIYTPDQVEQLLRSELDREKEERVREVGSMVEFGNALKEEGRTWPTYEREQRIEKLWQFANEFAVYRRMQRNANLFLTPTMLRETYRREIHQFVHPARARVAMVTFQGADANANAVRASTMWALQPASARDIAERFGGALAIAERPAASLATEFAAVSTFALAGPLGAVSPAIPIPGGFCVARVIEYVPAANGRFEDFEVQAQLRVLCERRVHQEFRQQAMERAKQRTEVWRSSIIDGQRSQPGR